MVIIDTVINTILGRVTLDPAGMRCPSWDEAFVSSFVVVVLFTKAMLIVLHCFLCFVYWFSGYWLGCQHQCK